jgi:hypothetical protein
MDHRCHRGDRCAAAVRVEVQVCTCACHGYPYDVCSTPGGCGYLHGGATVLVGVGIRAVRGLCITCERIAGDDIGYLSGDYVNLYDAQYVGMAGHWSEVVASTREMPIPISLSFTTLAEQIAYETLVFVEPVAEALNIDWDVYSRPRIRSRYGQTPQYRKQVTFDLAAHLLTTSIATLLALPVMDYYLWDGDQLAAFECDGLTATLGLASLHHAARATLGLTRLATQLPTPCPACGFFTLVREAGRDGVYCTGCRARWSDLDYERQTLIVVADHAVSSTPGTGRTAG